MERHIFRVVLEEERGGGCSVYVPALPGCASQGETREEALANIREAIELYLWSLKDDNLPLPEGPGAVEVREVEVAV